MRACSVSLLDYEIMKGGEVPLSSNSCQVSSVWLYAPVGEDISSSCYSSCVGLLLECCRSRRRLCIDMRSIMPTVVKAGAHEDPLIRSL